MSPDPSIESASTSFERLENGLRVLLLPSTMNNIVSLVCFVPLPGAIESPEETGIVHFTHKMLMRGTMRRSSAELSEAIESLGTSLSSDASDDYSHAHIVCTRDTFRESLELLAEVLQQPSFEPEEIEKERQSALSSIRRMDDDTFAYTYRHFLQQLYGGHSYGLPRLGLPETVKEFSRERICEIHSQYFDPACYTVVVVGHFEPDAARGMLSQLFHRSDAGSRPGPAPCLSQLQTVSPVAGRTFKSLNLSRDCEQAFLCAGFHACDILSQDFPALRVLNGVLGEGMSSRLFLKLRDEKGLAYSTGSSYSALQRGGHLVGYIGTKPESLEAAREGMLAEFQLIGSELTPPEELERARNYIIGKFLIDHQTNYRRAFYLGFYDIMGLGTEMDNLYPERIGAVTAEQVREAARRYITGEPVIVQLIPEQT